MRRLDVNRVSPAAKSLTEQFASRIVSQSDATQSLVRVVEKWQGGFYDKKRPIASVMFLGPTGTGKTATVEAFVEGLFGYPDHFLKVDCAEFQHSQNIAKIQGSPPGYLGHRDTKPYFTNVKLQELRTEKWPFTVILWDEIEKASDALWNLMLGILDKGGMTTGANEYVDFRQTIHVMTSNVGSAEMSDETTYGFASPGKIELGHNKLKTIAMNAAKKKFMPEFLNRLDRVVMFKTLTPDEVKRVLDFELDKVQRRVYLNCKVPFDIEVRPGAKAKLLEEGFDRRNNAREMRRTVEKYIELPLSNLVATAQIDRQDRVIVDYDGEWEFSATNQTVTSGIYAGPVEVPTLQESAGITPAPRPVREPRRTRRTKQPVDPVLEVS